MACGALFTVAVSLYPCWTGSIRIEGLSAEAIGVVMATAMLVPLPAYWHQKGQLDKRDAALTIPWALLMTLLLPVPFIVAARLRFPMQDLLLARADHLLGFSTPALRQWAAHHWLGDLLEHSYQMLQPLMLTAVLLPGLAGKREAREFLLANLMALMVVGVIFALMPAVGPWYAHAFVPSDLQRQCEDGLMQLRRPETYTYSFLVQGAGIVCFPSCHVLWAILCAAALWGFRWLRIPVAALSGLIIISTLTTGWHYLVDVLAGLVLAVGALVLSKRILRSGVLG
jgi:membrane-associated phospholipid phosphatase